MAGGGAGCPVVSPSRSWRRLEQQFEELSFGQPQQQPAHEPQHQQWVSCGVDLFTAFERRRGLPIGNQTSQFFANVYLDALDHFVKQSLRCRAYVRYVDDFLLCDDDPQRLVAWRERIRRVLTALRLHLHPTKCQVFPSAQGARFLGFRVFPTHRRLTKESIRCARKRLREMQRGFALRKLRVEKLSSRIVAWLGHARHGDTWHLVDRLFREQPFCRGVASP